jgi:predicted phosphodiesterase
MCPAGSPAAKTNRLAALYDIHANLPALEAVLGEIRLAGVDQIVVGGDVVPGPMPRETIACLLDLDVPVRIIQGNGDREVLALMRGGDGAAVPERFREAMRWNARQLGADEERLLAGWPATLHLHIDGIGDTVFCHDTPRNDTEIFTRRTPEDRLVRIFDPLNARLVVCGHTHMQFDRSIGRTRVVNAGSVGMPFQEPGAYWLLLGPDVQLRRTGYDLAEAAARIRATGYPQAEEFAARNVLEPPSEQDTLDAFTRVELR